MKQIKNFLIFTLLIVVAASCDKSSIDNGEIQQPNKTNSSKNTVENLIGIVCHTANSETETSNVIITRDELAHLESESNYFITLQNIEDILYSDEAASICPGGTTSVVFGGASDIPDRNVLNFYKSCNNCTLDSAQRFIAQDAANSSGTGLIIAIDCYYTDAFGNVASCPKLMTFYPEW